MNVTVDAATARDGWEIPLQFVRSGIPLIVVPVSVNGSEPLSFIVDTGNATAAFILSQRTAAKLPLPAAPGSSFSGPTAVGSAPVEILEAHVDTLSVGPFCLSNITVGVSDAIDRLSGAIGAEIDGNVGYPFLRELVLVIDYPRQILKLSTSAMAAPNAAVFQLGVPKPLILISAFVNDAGPFRFALDTGAGSVVVSSELATRLGLERGPEIPMHGAGGAAQGFLTQLRGLSFAGVHLRDVSAVSGDIFGPLRIPVGGELDGIIGYNAMNNLCVTIDYPRQQISFSK